MCGIFGQLGTTRQAPKNTLGGLKRLEYRGYDSWGVVWSQKGQLQLKKRVGKIGEAQLKGQGTVALGHTRWATHGGVNKKNAHPHLDCTQTYAVVHNGIVDNFQQLRKQLTHKGHNFISETDTEVFPHLLEEYNFFESFKRLRGLNAVIALDSAKKKLFAAKRGSPLVLGYGKDHFYVASDASALLPYTKRVYFLEDGEGAVLSPDGIKVIDLKDQQEVFVQPSILDWSVQEARLQGYAHFMLKEINEQPEVIRTVAENSTQEIKSLVRAINKAYGVYFVGSGTAYHAAVTGVYLLSKIAGRHINHISGSEFPYLSDFIKRGSLVAALTQSGETIDVVEALQTAKVRGAELATLVNVVGSTVYRMADEVVTLKAGIEKCVLATKSYLAKLSTLILLAYALRGDFLEGQKKLHQVADSLEDYLKQPEKLDQIKNLAKSLQNSQHIYVIGRGASYPDALEGALKIKEVSYIHTEGFAGGDLKHGSIALIEQKTPIIVLAPKDRTYKSIISNAMEVKARGARLIGLSPEPHEVFDEWIKVADVKNGSNILQAVPLQLLGYYLALEKNLDPDKPRNLAKSVTVK